MARPKIHDYPAPKLLQAIANASESKRLALEAILADAQAEQAAEQQAQKESHARRVAAGMDYADWARLHPDPPRSDAWRREYDAKRDLAELAATGIPYRLEEFTGCPDLTPSARIAAQTSIRSLERDGLVQLFGARATSLRLTPAGRAAAGLPEVANA